jgi:hypothetical protein
MARGKVQVGIDRVPTNPEPGEEELREPMTRWGDLHHLLVY